MNALDEVITVSEAAIIRKVSDRRIRQMCEQSLIAARQDFKGNWLILKSSLERLVDEKKQNNS